MQSENFRIRNVTTREWFFISWFLGFAVAPAGLWWKSGSRHPEDISRWTLKISSRSWNPNWPFLIFCFDVTQQTQAHHPWFRTNNTNGKIPQFQLELNWECFGPKAHWHKQENQLILVVLQLWSACTLNTPHWSQLIKHFSTFSKSNVSKFWLSTRNTFGFLPS